jgi:hypothetical protein
MKAVVCLAAIALVSCSSGTQSPSGESAPPPSGNGALLEDVHGGAAQTRGPVIATVVTRDSKVAVVGGGTELRVIVRKADGALVADGLSLAELRARDPFLALVVESAVAGNGGGTYIDATFRQEKQAPKTKLLSDL